MLRDKYRMSTHRSLFSVIRYIGRSLTLCNKIRGVLSDGVDPLLIYVVNVFPAQMKSAAEPGIAQPFKQLPVPFFPRHQNFTTSGSFVNDEKVAYTTQG